ncbi:SusC/RagA family TonB-linked outer membrane protein [Flavitalea antarctica]
MRKAFLPLLLFLCLSTIAVAQAGKITGSVKDSKTGAPLAGVTVKVAGGRATMTSADGSFTIESKTPETTIELSSIGYTSKSQKVKVGELVTANMDYDSKSLSEVVVTGVGVATSKKKLAISVESVTADKLPPAPTASVDQALIGKIPGAQISSTNGSPGAKTNILLRGINTINRGTSPMIMLDGLEVRATDINGLDLNTVERIEVVQGAAAATIYGAQGANGVIQLFSKKGKMGKMNIDVSSSFAINEIINSGNVSKSSLHPFTTNAAGEVIGSSGNLITLDPALSLYRENVQVNLVDVNTFSNKPYDKNLRYYDHYDQFLKEAYTTNNSLAISGAREKVDFSFSLSDNRQTSNFENNGKYSRTNLTSNLGLELAKGLKFRSITQLVYTKNTLNDATGRGVFFALNNSRPFADYNYKMPDGNYGYYFGDATGVNGYNPNYRNSYSTNLDNKIDVVQSFNLNYKPVKFVDLDVKYGLNYQTQDITYDVLPQDVNANAAFNRRFWSGNYYSSTNPGQTGSIDNFRNRTTFQNFLSTATFVTDFENDFNMNVPIRTTTQVAFDYRENIFKQYITWGGDAPQYTPYTASQMVNYRIQSDYTEPFVTYGYLVNQRFEYGDIGGISAGFRSDYSSAFGGGSKPFTFPRGDAYIRPSSFNFWKNGMLGNAIPEFKLRAAYGEAGIQPRPFDRYVVLSTANFGNGIAFSYPTNSPNPELEVEVSKELEIGTDFSIKALKGNWLSSINISGTYWDRKTANAIYNVDAAPSTGTGTVRDNAFGLASSGFQASLNAVMFTSKDLTWGFTTNFSKQSSKITSVLGGTPIVVLSNAGSSNYILRAGEKIGQLYGYLLINQVDQLDPSGNPFIPKAQQGNYVVAGNGYVVDKTTKQPFVSSGKYSFGDPNPLFNMSFINDVSFKTYLSFSMQWDWVNGSHLYNQTKGWMYRDGIHSDYSIPVEIDGKTEAYTAFYRGVYAQREANGTKNYFYEDASFMRLRNLSVAFDFAKFFTIPGFHRLQLVLSGRNLVTITDYTGFDPEISSGTSNSAFDRGVDHNTIPNLKTYQVGLNIGL